MKAAGRYLGGNSDFGGSTITQQLVKNLTGNSEKNIKRKAEEILRAAKIEKRLSKNEILEQYLNIVNLSENCYGVRTASNAFFSKEPYELTAREAATLAAVTQNPARYDPVKHPEENRARRDLVLSEMYAQGMIDKKTYEEAKSEPTVLSLNENALSGRINSFYADLVIEDVIGDLMLEKGISRAAASRAVYCGGLKIFVTMDPEIQQIVSDFYADPDNFPTHEGGKKAQSSMLIVDPTNGDILAVAGAVGDKNSNRVQNYATTVKRPSGSVVKPLSVYAPALSAGKITWSTVFDDVPLKFRDNGAPWPRNSPNLYRGLTTVAEALTHSVNTVCVSILEELGNAASIDFLREKLEIRSIDAVKDSNETALALGQQTEGVSLREIVGGYTALANGGVFSGTRSYTKVLDADDQLLLLKNSAERQVLGAENASILTLMLRRVVGEGTAKSLKLKNTVDVAGKTGTSSKNCDKWFVGYTPELLAGVWYGFEYPAPLSDVKGNPALDIFDAVMEKVLEKHAPKIPQFPTDENLVAVRYCKDSGKLPGDACSLDARGDRTEIGYFKKGTEPTEKCDRHVIVRYCEDGGVAGEDCPAEKCRDVALVRVLRIFPRQIRVEDAPYTYGGEVAEKLREIDESEPYYAANYATRQFFGIGMGEIPFNRACAGEEDFWKRRAALSG